MAEIPAQVLDFLHDLAARRSPSASAISRSCASSRARRSGCADLAAWDMAYASEKLRVARYAFSEQEVKQYFPEDAGPAGHVRRGRDALRPAIIAARRRAALASGRALLPHHRSLRAAGRPVLHRPVRAAVASAAARGWTKPSRGGGSRRASRQPVAYLNCNFSAPVGGQPALFTHDEVITLFHEFGHGLHHLLTQVEELGVSGINGVEWDAVELPSQFMENFCWEWDVLRHMTRHVETKDPLPRALFDKMLAAKNFQSGLQTLRQIEFALFDMRLHHDFDPAGERSLRCSCWTRCGAGGGDLSAGLQPLSEQLLAHLRRRVRRRLLQLQVGGGAVGRRLQPVRGTRRARPGDRRALPARDPRRGRQPPGARILRRLPGPRAQPSTPCCGTTAWSGKSRRYLASRLLARDVLFFVARRNFEGGPP